MAVATPFPGSRRREPTQGAGSGSPRWVAAPCCAAARARSRAGACPTCQSPAPGWAAGRPRKAPRACIKTLCKGIRHLLIVCRGRRRETLAAKTLTSKLFCFLYLLSEIVTMSASALRDFDCAAGAPRAPVEVLQHRPALRLRLGRAVRVSEQPPPGGVAAARRRAQRAEAMRVALARAARPLDEHALLRARGARAEHVQRPRLALEVVRVCGGA